MGRAKAWLPWFGKTMIEHVVATLLPVVDEVIVVTSEEVDLPPLEARVIFDREQGGGPLVGIREGLRAARAEFAFVTSVDAPFLGSDFVEDLLALGCAAAPTADGHVQVLSAVYPCAAWRVADALLEQDSRRPLRLLERLDYKRIETTSTDGPAPWRGFNTPKEYLDSVRQREPDAVAEIEFLGRAARSRNRLHERLAVGTLGDLFAQVPDTSALLSEGRVRKSHLVCLGGRDLVRDLSVPVGPGERVSVIDALAGG
jgi:molybdopterin-guanine dinucleotide biosynthesis protein A